MGFQQPPALPDYSKLLTSLNASDVQKWNPPLYNILKLLIQAVGQSQDVITKNAADVINNFASAVIVDPNGAILGDGTSGSPLKTNPDGTTIQIIANQLVATAGAVIFTSQASTPFFDSVAGASGFTVSPNTTVLTVSAVPGSVIIPLKFYLTSNKNDNGANNALWSPTTSLEAVYNTTGFPVIGNFSSDVFFGSVGTHNQSSLNSSVAVLAATSTLNEFINKSLIIRTNNTINCVSTANKFIENIGRVAVTYVILPVTPVVP
jgi:hypothetical protein